MSLGIAVVSMLWFVPGCGSGQATNEASIREGPTGVPSPEVDLGDGDVYLDDDID